MFAVIQTGGKQYLVKENQTLKIEKLAGDKGGTLVFDKVLLTAADDGSNVQIGAPTLGNAKVEAEVLEQGRGKKVLVIKYKRKVRYHKKRGHRQHYTKVLIKKIIA